MIDDEPSYGGATDNILAWESPGPGTPEGKVPPIGVARAAGSPPPEGYETTLGSRVNQNYAGLSRYVDTTDNENKYGMFAPSLIIALTQEETDFNSNGGTEPTRPY